MSQLKTFRWGGNTEYFPDGRLGRLTDVDEEGDAATRIRNAGGKIVARNIHGHIVWVDFDQLDDSTISRLIPLRHLRIVLPTTSSKSNVSDAGLELLSRMPELPIPRMMSDRITDRGIAHLKRLNNLMSLSAHSDRVTGSALSHLAGCNSLRRLRLYRWRIEDGHLVHLANLNRLTDLSLTALSVTDQGLVHIQPLHSLQSLDLSRTAVTDAGMRTVATMSGLQYLGISGTKVTDSGLLELAHNATLHASATKDHSSLRLGLIDSVNCGHATLGTSGMSHRAAFYAS